MKCERAREEEKNFRKLLDAQYKQCVERKHTKTHSNSVVRGAAIPAITKHISKKCSTTCCNNKKYSSLLANCLEKRKCRVVDGTMQII